MTPYKRHKRQYHNCTRCCLCKTRSTVVLARGRVPAPILMVGEAPGASENVLGRPFCGPAGKLLDRILEQAIDGQHDYCLTNLVCCLPVDEDGNKAGEPSKECIEACAPRLREFVAMCRPRLIVCLGKLADKWVPKILKDDGRFNWRDRINILHPAAILRMDLSQQGLAIQRCIVTIEDAVSEMH